MARLLQIFGFLSVLFRGAILTFQSLTIGGIVFLSFILRCANPESGAIRHSCLRWIRRAATALAIMQISYVLANSLILMQSADMTLAEVSGANFVIAGAIGIISAIAIAILCSARPSRSSWDLLFPAAAIIASSVMTSHAMARLEFRAPLVAVTALHQAATAVWLGGLPYLLIAIRRATNPDLTRQFSARFSQVALCSVCMLAAAGFVLSFAYVGSFKAAFGTSYGAMVSAKVVLFGLLLFLGALNYQLVRRGSASSIVSSLKRFGEAELGIGITVILTAASLTSLPPAASRQPHAARTSRRRLRRTEQGIRGWVTHHRILRAGTGRHTAQYSSRESVVGIQPSLGGHHRSEHWTSCVSRASKPGFLGAPLAAGVSWPGDISVLAQ